jgi:putative transposase
MLPEHGPMGIAIPPKDAVVQVIGSMKGKSAIAVARQFGGKTRNFPGERFWAWGDAGSTGGCEVEQVRPSIREQNDRDQRDDKDDGWFEQLTFTLAAFEAAPNCQASGYTERYDYFSVLRGAMKLLTDMPAQHKLNARNEWARSHKTNQRTLF